MRIKYLGGVLVLLALVVPVSPAYGGGVVSICDEAHLLAALAGGGTVTFSCSGTITLSATITIAADTTIDGSGQTVTISGNNVIGVFTVNNAITLNLNRLTVANGSADLGGGIYNLAGTVTVSNSTFSGNWANHGGGIYNQSALTVSNSTFSGNSVGGRGGGIHNDGGTVTVSNSTFFGNQGGGSGGGGIKNDGVLAVTNSTFSDNWAPYEGGGIYSQGTLTVSNSTFSGNGASWCGGGICAYGTVTLKNTIVANSPTGGNCSGAITDGDGNLSYPDTTCPGINSDPVLGPLQNNGGPTQTMELGSGSAAINAANDATCAAAPVHNRDQRGIARPQGEHCDIGAVEQYCPSFVRPASVGVEDIVAMATRWGWTNASPGWDPIYDLNGDNRIDIVDITLVTRTWGATCS